jgi:very-short-patch-repair endonuclease
VSRSDGRGVPVANLRARNLRWNMTDAERYLWAILRRKRFAGPRFRRQHPIAPYIADFFCPAAKLIVELDGGHHAEEKQSLHDKRGTRWLEARGYRVLRLWNTDLKRNPAGVREVIYEALRYPPSGPTGHLPPQGGEKMAGEDDVASAPPYDPEIG